MQREGKEKENTHGGKKIKRYKETCDGSIFFF